MLQKVEKHFRESKNGSTRRENSSEVGKMRMQKISGHDRFISNEVPLAIDDPEYIPYMSDNQIRSARRNPLKMLKWLYQTPHSCPDIRK